MKPKPSIFTSRESFSKRPTVSPGPSKSTPTAHDTSHVRRQSTPDALESHRLQAASRALSLIPGGGIGSYSAAIGTEQGVLASGTVRTHQPTWHSSQPSDLSRGRASPSTATPRLRSASTSRATASSLLAEHPPPNIKRAAGNQAGRKRYTGENEERGPDSEPSRKRQKLSVKPRGKHFLETFSPGFATVQPDSQPLSPLFFSNSPHARPSLPPRFSSSEAAAKMLSKARSEDSHVKTVSLARGIVSTNSSPPTSAPHPPMSPYRTASDRPAPVVRRSNSPDGPSRQDVGAMLGSVGILELLELDERPTFIVDLAFRDNYGAGPLHLVFANSALRSYTGLESLVSGQTPDAISPGAGSHLQFKSWLMSATINGESLDVCLPSFVFANMSWNCSTLRKRLRLISGAFLATPVQGRPSSHRSSLAPTAPPTSMSYQEPSDYFGSALAPQSATPVTDPLPSVEVPSSGSAKSSVSPATIMVDSGMGAVTTRRTTPSELATRQDSSSRYTAVPESVPAISVAVSSSSSSYESPSIIAQPDAPSFDWTRLPVSDSMPSHIQFARSVDWASTALGPIENWCSDLRQMCNLIMASPHPAAMYWGEEYIAIYNEAYVLLAGQKHPKLMGQSYSEAWAEIWDDVKDVFASARMTGEATMKDDDCLFMRRSNYLEETYFSWSIIPMVGRDGSVMGLYNPAFEKTRRKIAERRMLTLREVGERTASARDVKGFWAQVLESFKFNEYDSPILLLYSVSEENDSDSSSINSTSTMANRQCFLEGKLGIPDGHAAAPLQIDLRYGTEGFGPAFQEVVRTDRHQLLEVGSRDLPESLLKNLDWRGFPDPVRAVVVCPIHPTTGENILGFLVLGVNPRRPYDDDYALFVQLLSRQLATSLASVVLFEEEIRRGQRAAKLAALDRIELSEKLALRTQEAAESEMKFARMAEFAPVGMVIAGSDGSITFANDSWYDISRAPVDQSMSMTWLDSVNADDRAMVESLWENLTVRKKLVSAEFRFKSQWEDRNGIRGDTWVLFSGYPEKDEEGGLKRVFATITNISQQKWAESIQTRKMEEAVEMKRQQENFIDITSHEMRNPLSAILQCSDEISNSLTKLGQARERAGWEDVLTSCLDAAQIINLCAQHQKRIVDDILTLSKLDSKLLLVTPVDAQPLTVVQRALKMHESGLQAADIRMKFVVHQTYRDLDLDWVRFDPSRVLQVLINLTTNAIKFTGTESKRIISVTISACRERPGDHHAVPVKYFPTRRQDQDVASEKDWGDGEKLYIHFAVSDTGRGLSPDEKKMLFLRFSQASPRTHVQYGGSGLGLFISRELTELQGGEIGVESEAGKGSTFAFYVVARRSNPPAETEGATPFGSGPHHSRKKSVPFPAASKTSDKQAEAAESSSKEAAPRPAEPKKNAVRRVLIVEDNLVNQRVLQKQLKNNGLEVHVANHGGEALEKLKQSTYWIDPSSPPQGAAKLQLGVVLMDQEMPVMDGLTCTRKIRELEKEGKLSGHVPIIAVTANARPEQVRTIMDAGMDDVVAKPFRIPELIPKIEELLERYPPPEV